MGFKPSRPPIGVKQVRVGEGGGLDMGPGTTTRRIPATPSTTEAPQGGSKEKGK